MRSTYAVYFISRVNPYVVLHFAPRLVEGGWIIGGSFGTLAKARKAVERHFDISPAAVHSVILEAREAYHRQNGKKRVERGVVMASGAGER